MTELAVRPEARTDAQDQLVAWATAAQAAHDLALALCRTDFVPDHFRDNPGGATAAILYGAEAGLSPLQALQGIYVINGRPAMYARTMLALVLAAGHAVWTEDATDSRVIVCGRRRGSQQIERSVWTVERARKAGYTRNSKYGSDPQAMLTARAHSDICRRVGPDALYGLSYSIEELELADNSPEAPPVPAQAKRTVQRATAPALPAAGTALPPTAPALRESDWVENPAPDEPVLLVEVVGPPLEDELRASAPQPRRDDAIAPRQRSAIMAALASRGISDRDSRLAHLAKEVGHPVASTNDLTKDEASQVIEALTASGPRSANEEPAAP